MTSIMRLYSFLQPQYRCWRGRVEMDKDMKAGSGGLKVFREIKAKLHSSQTKLKQATVRHRRAFQDFCQQHGTFPLSLKPREDSEVYEDVLSQLEQAIAQLRQPLKNIETPTELEEFLTGRVGEKHGDSVPLVQENEERENEERENEEQENKERENEEREKKGGMEQEEAAKPHVQINAYEEPGEAEIQPLGSQTKEEDWALRLDKLEQMLDQTSQQKRKGWNKFLKILVCADGIQSEED